MQGKIGFIAVLLQRVLKSNKDTERFDDICWSFDFLCLSVKMYLHRAVLSFTESVSIQYSCCTVAVSFYFITIFF